MSRTVLKNPVPKQHLASKIPTQSPAMRDVKPLPVVQASQDLMTPFKDLNSQTHVHRKLQKLHLIIAVVAFTLLGLGLFMGNYFSSSRSLAGASAFYGFNIQGTPTRVEHYQYDKSCYKNETGEDVCVTRTSQKR